MISLCLYGRHNERDDSHLPEPIFVSNTLADFDVHENRTDGRVSCRRKAYSTKYVEHREGEEKESSPSTKTFRDSLNVRAHTIAKRLPSVQRAHACLLFME